MKCKGCNGETDFISPKLGHCVECIRAGREEALESADRLHKLARSPFGLPPEIPKDPEGIECNLCGNACRIPNTEKGFCGTKINHEGKLVHLAGDGGRGILQWYHDPLPT